MRHPWPLQSMLAPIQLGANFLYWTRAACLQFVFVKPASVSTLVSLMISYLSGSDSLLLQYG